MYWLCLSVPICVEMSIVFFSCYPLFCVSGWIHVFMHLLLRIYSLQIKQPILFLSGLQDEMVPPSHMQMLYAKAAARNNQCLFVEFPTGMHMDTWLAGGDHYWRTIQQFLEQHAPVRKERNANGNLFPSCCVLKLGQ